MTRVTRLAARGVLALLLIGVAGCNLSKPYPDKAFFAIDAGQPARAAHPISPLTLRIYSILVARPYDVRAFVYKTGASRFETDYYNGFIAAPSELLTGTLVDWMKRAGLFAVVVDSDSRMADQFVLEGNVREMYGDYSDRRNPQAVMTAAFFLIDDRPVDGRVIFQKTYHVSAPVGAKGPEALSAALNAAWRNILTDLTADLAGVQVAADDRGPADKAVTRPSPAGTEASGPKHPAG